MLIIIILKHFFQQVEVFSYTQKEENNFFF